MPTTAPQKAQGKETEIMSKVVQLVAIQTSSIIQSPVSNSTRCPIPGVGKCLNMPVPYCPGIRTGHHNRTWGISAGHTYCS